MAVSTAAAVLSAEPITRVIARTVRPGQAVVGCVRPDLAGSIARPCVAIQAECCRA